MGNRTGMKSKPAFAAKISRTVVADSIPRRRLFEELDRLRSKPLIWISGPPGSGKTTLVSSYLDAAKISFIWYQLDEGDDDISRFFYYMGLAVKKVAPRKKKPMPPLSHEYLPVLPAFTRRYFEELFSRMTAPFFLIFDDYQQVPSQSILHNVVGEILNVTPNQYNVIVISRQSPPQQLIRYKANNAMGSISHSDIMFSREESREFIRRRGFTGLSEKGFLKVYEQTQGWAAGLLLITEAIETVGLDMKRISRVTPETIFSYFANEVFERTDKKTQEFLLKTACLKKVDPHVARELTGIEHSEKILNFLYDKNFFLQRQPLNKHIYHFYPLFRDFLLSKASNEMSHEEMSDLRMKAAKLLEKAGHIGTAFFFFQGEQSWDNCIRLIMANAPSYRQMGRTSTIEKWIQSIPIAERENQPWLLYWFAVCKQPYEPAESQGYFEKAFELFSSQEDILGVFLAWAGIVESITYGYESLQLLDDWLAVLEKLLKTYKGFPSQEIEAHVLCGLFKIFTLRKPLHSDTGEWVERCHALSEKSTNLPLKIKLLTIFAEYLYSEGNFMTLDITLTSLQELLKRFDAPPMIKLTVYWLQAAFFNVMSLYDECLMTVFKGLKLAHSLKIGLMEYMLMGHGVLSALKKGNSLIAKRYLQKMSSGLSFAKPWERGFYHYCAAWRALYNHDLAQARTHAEHCVNLCQDIGDLWTMTIANILQSYIAHAFGDSRQAMQYISAARSLGVRTNNMFTHFMCFLTEAYFHLQQGEEESAVKSIRSGISIGKNHGFVNLFMWPAGVMETILAKAIDHSIEEKYTKQLIRRNDLHADARNIISERWPWKMKIFTLGRFDLLKEGIPLRFSGKVQHKPLVLLKAIIAFGGRQVDQAQLIDALWPDSAGDMAYTAFKTTIHRLRHLIGMEDAIKVEDGHVTLDPRVFWVDSWTLQRLSGQVDEMWKGGEQKTNPKYFIHLCEKAIAFFQGDFLPGDAVEPWIVPMREKLKNKFLQLVMRVCECYEGTEQWDEAALVCAKGLEIDDLAEELYQRLMICYQRLGRNTDAFSVYQQCCKVLHAISGIEPSRKTVEIYKAIMANAAIQHHE